MPFLSPLFTLRLMLCLTDCLQGAFRCSFVCMCSSMHKKAEESLIQYSRGVDAAVCVRALQMCVCACTSDVCVCVHFRCVCVCVCARTRKTSHTALDCYSKSPERLVCSSCTFGQSLYRVLIREIEGECTR